MCDVDETPLILSALHGMQTRIAEISNSWWISHLEGRISIGIPLRFEIKLCKHSNPSLVGGTCMKVSEESFPSIMFS